MMNTNSIHYQVVLWLDFAPVPETRQWELYGATGANADTTGDRLIELGLRLQAVTSGPMVHKVISTQRG